MKARVAHFLLVTLLSSACMVRQSAFEPLPIVVEDNLPLHTSGLPKLQTGCGWVVVDEIIKKKFLGLTVSKKARHFERALFYCCPGSSKPEPKCFQADWYYRENK